MNTSCSALHTNTICIINENVLNITGRARGKRGAKLK